MEDERSDDLLKKWGGLLDLVSKLDDYCAREGLRLGSISLRGRMHPTFLIQMASGIVEVKFPEYEQAIERQKRRAQAEDFKRRHANCPGCVLCSLQNVLDRYDTEPNDAEPSSA